MLSLIASILAIANVSIRTPGITHPNFKVFAAGNCVGAPVNNEPLNYNEFFAFLSNVGLFGATVTTDLLCTFLQFWDQPNCRGNHKATKLDGASNSSCIAIGNAPNGTLALTNRVNSVFVNIC